MGGFTAPTACFTQHEAERDGVVCLNDDLLQVAFSIR
jgi:hypothetical protein